MMLVVITSVCSLSSSVVGTGLSELFQRVRIYSDSGRKRCTGTLAERDDIVILRI
jgi:hypothetical protein